MKKYLLSLAAFAASFCVSAQDSLRIYHIDEVVVTGTRNNTDVRHLPLTITQVSRPQLEQSFSQSVIPAVTQLTPGLFTTSRGIIGYGVSTGSAGSMKIRGVGSGAQLMVLIDGQPQYAGLMGHPIPDAYQTMMTEKVEVLRGPASMFYGSNAMAGVINIVTRQAQEGSKTNMRLSAGSYGTLQAEASNTYKKNAFSSIVGASYQRTDGHRENSEFSQFSGFAKLGYELNTNWKLNGDMNLTHFNYANPGPESAPLIDNDGKITRGLASVSLTNSFANTNGALRVYFDWGHHNIDDGYTAGASPKAYLYKHNDYIGCISWYQSVSLFEGNRVTAGIDFQQFGGAAWNADKNTGARTNLVKDDDGNLVDNLHQSEIAGYVDFRQELATWASLELGLRVDHHSIAGTELVPQGGISFHVSPTSDLKAMVSKGFRNPIIREMYMFPPSNTELEPERMMNYELSYSQRIGKGHIGANIYYIDGENLIATTRIDGRPKNLNMGEFTNYGFELNGDYRFNAHWSMDANYSFLHMKKRMEGAPESKFYLGVNYAKKRFGMNIGLQQVDGLFITTGENAEKESFTLLNASLTYSLSQTTKFFAKGENLLGQCYQTYQGFYMPRATFMGGIDINF